MNYTYGYARVSADDQNLATQLDTLERDGCDKIYQEKVTGVRVSSPALDNMLKVLRPGDTVKVARFFRLGRNTAHLIGLLDQFKQDGIRFIALDLGVDTSTPAGTLMLTIFAGLAQFQREELLEKTKHGRQLAKAAGTHMGRRPGVNEKQLAKVQAGLAANMSVAKIAEVTAIPLSTVKRYVRLLKAREETKQ